jgi:hypothetical protein
MSRQAQKLQCLCIHAVQNPRARPNAVKSPHDFGLQGYESGATRIIDGLSEDGEAAHAASSRLVPLGDGPAGGDGGRQRQAGAPVRKSVDDGKQRLEGKSGAGILPGVPKLVIGKAIKNSMEEEVREVEAGRGGDGEGPGLKWLREQACDTDEESSSSSVSVTESTTPTSQKPGPSTAFSSRKKPPTSQPVPTSPPTSYSPPQGRGSFSPPTLPLGDEAPSKASTTPNHPNSARPSLSNDPMSLLLSPPTHPSRPPTRPPKRGDDASPRPEAPQPESASRRISINRPTQPGQVHDVPRQPRSPPTSGGSTALSPDQAAAAAAAAAAATAAAAADGGDAVGGITISGGGGGSGRIKRQSSSSRRFSPPESERNPPTERATLHALVQEYWPAEYISYTVNASAMRNLSYLGTVPCTAETCAITDQPYTLPEPNTLPLPRMTPKGGGGRTTPRGGSARASPRVPEDAVAAASAAPTEASGSEPQSHKETAHPPVISGASLINAATPRAASYALR